MQSVIDGPQHKAEAAPQDAPAPSDDELATKWPQLAKVYESKPRLANMLSSTELEITPAEDGAKTVTFRVVNEAQKDWVESKLLHDLEGNYRKIVGSSKVYLRVSVVPDDTPEVNKVYMPSDQAKVLMAQNDEVKNLVQDLGLDIK
jgi:hypothetical protein